MKKTAAVALVLAALVLLSSCTGGDKQKGAVLKISAAASLTDALTEIMDTYRKETGINYQLSFASSSTCARQIKAGQECSLFISADKQWVDYLSGLYSTGSKRALLGNRLVIAVPTASQLNIQGPESLAGPEVKRIAMGDPSHVPAGIYGKAALEKAGIWKSVEKKVVGAMDVRAALSLVSSSAVDCAVVYRTDAISDDSVRIAWQFPPDEKSPVRYYICRFGKTEAGKDLYDYLFSDAALAQFEKYGFTGDRS